MYLYLTNFLLYSNHLGHYSKNSIILSSWFFFKLRKKIWIINILKTILFLKLSFNFIKFLVNSKLPFWFINLDETKHFIFKKYSIFCGEYFCTKYWIRGLISNFKSIQKSLNKYFLQKYLIKRERKNIIIKNWSLTRYTWPRGIFIANVQSNYIVSKEVNSMQIPIVGLVDTNIKSFLYKFPIPSNDDSMFSICYIVSIIAKKFLLLKYKNLILWYTYYQSKYYIKIMKKFKSLFNLNNFNNKIKKLVVLNKLNFFKTNLLYLFVLKKMKAIKGFNLLNFKMYRVMFRFFNFYKRLSILYSYFKKSFFKLKFKISKRYKNLIKNFIKLEKFPKKKKFKNYFFKKPINKKMAFNRFGLTNFYLKKLYNYSLLWSDIFYKPKFVNLVFLINVYRWWSLRQRYYYGKYFKRRILHYWLFPKILKFSIRRSKIKKKWYHSMFYFQERNMFFKRLRYKYRKKIYLIKSPFIQYYKSWFFFLLNNKYKRNV